MYFVQEIKERPMPSERDNGYEDMVDFYLKIGDEIPSFGPEQSSIVFRKLIERTRHKIIAVLGSFSGPISNNKKYISAISNCLNRGVEVSVLFLDSPNKDSQVYQMLLTHITTTVKMYESTSNTKEYLTKQFSQYSSICHFAVFDNKFYRKEIDTKNFIGIASTNDVKEVKKLNQIFEASIKLSIPHSTI